MLKKMAAICMIVLFAGHLQTMAQLLPQLPQLPDVGGLVTAAQTSVGGALPGDVGGGDSSLPAAAEP